MSSTVSQTVTPGVITRIADVVGTHGLITDAVHGSLHRRLARRGPRGNTKAVVRPDTTAEVAAVVKICAEAGNPIVPQGGNTGMCMGPFHAPMVTTSC